MSVPPIMLPPSVYAEAKAILDREAERLLAERIDSHTCPICKRTWHEMPYPICFDCRTNILVDATGMARVRAERVAERAIGSEPKKEAGGPPPHGALNAALKVEHARQQRREKARAYALNRKPSLRDLERVMYVLDGFSSMQVATFTDSRLSAVRGALRGAAGRRVADVLVSIHEQLRPEGEL